MDVLESVRLKIIVPAHMHQENETDRIAYQRPLALFVSLLGPSHGLQEMGIPDVGETVAWFNVDAALEFFFCSVPVPVVTGRKLYIRIENPE